MALVEKITVGKDDGFRVEARPAFGAQPADDLWDLLLWQQGSNHAATVQIEVEGLLEAELVAQELYALLRPYADAKHARDTARYARVAAELNEKSRRRKNDRRRKVEKAKKRTPVEVHVCGDCLYASPDPAEWDMAIYECSSCGNVQQSEDGNRCTQCNRFMSKLADRSCPECGSVDEPSRAKALKLDDGDYEILEAPKPATTLRPLAKVQTLSAAQGGRK